MTVQSVAVNKSLLPRESNSCFKEFCRRCTKPYLIGLLILGSGLLIGGVVVGSLSDGGNAQRKDILIQVGIRGGFTALGGAMGLSLIRRCYGY